MRRVRLFLAIAIAISAAATQASAQSFDFGGFDFGGIEFGGIEFGGIDGFKSDMKDPITIENKSAGVHWISVSAYPTIGGRACHAVSGNGSTLQITFDSQLDDTRRPCGDYDELWLFLIVRDQQRELDLYYGYFGRPVRWGDKITWTGSKFE